MYLNHYKLIFSIFFVFCSPLLRAYTLSYSTYIDSESPYYFEDTYTNHQYKYASRETNDGVATDSEGNIYVHGYAKRTDSPNVTPIYIEGGYGEPTDPIRNSYIYKLSPDGTVLYTAYFGPANIYSIAVNDSGEVVFAGKCPHFDDDPFFADTCAIADANYFVAKLSSDGSSILAGRNFVHIFDIDIDSENNIYLVGENMGDRISSSEHAYYNTTEDALNREKQSFLDAYLVTLDANTFDIIYATSLGGSYDDFVDDVYVDADDNVYVTGQTFSPDFNGVMGNSGETDIYVSKFMDKGREHVFTTYLGGSGEEFMSSVAVTSEGNILIAGNTRSDDLPTTSDSFAFGVEAPSTFISQLDPLGSQIFLSYFSDLYTGVSSIFVNHQGEIFLAGDTLPYITPMSEDSLHFYDVPFQRVGYFLKITLDGQIHYSTTLGGNVGHYMVVHAWSYVTGIIETVGGNVALVGQTSTRDFPITKNAFNKIYERNTYGGTTGFISVFSPSEITINSTLLPPLEFDVEYEHQFEVDGGTPPYTWEISAAAVLSTDITLDENTGILSGIVSEPGNGITSMSGINQWEFSKITISVTDSEGNVAYSSQIIQQVEHVEMRVRGRMNSGRIDEDYSQMFEIRNGLPPYRVSLYSGELPPGLTLTNGGVFYEPLTDGGLILGEISGRPTMLGVYSFVLQVEDSIGGIALSMEKEIQVRDENGSTLTPTPTPTFQPGNQGSGGGSMGTTFLLLLGLMSILRVIYPPNKR